MTKPTLLASLVLALVIGLPVDATADDRGYRRDRGHHRHHYRHHHEAHGKHRGYFRRHHANHHQRHYRRHARSAHYRHHGRHGGSHLGIYFSAPLHWGASPIYPPYSHGYGHSHYPRETVIIEREPPVYVEKAKDYWYYCPSPAGYYPYVQNCPQQWVTVDPDNAPPVRPR